MDADLAETTDVRLARHEMMQTISFTVIMLIIAALLLALTAWTARAAVHAGRRAHKCHANDGVYIQTILSGDYCVPRNVIIPLE